MARTSETGGNGRAPRKGKPPLPEPLTYTVEQAAALVGISPDSYYRSLKEGERSGDPKVPGRKFRGRWIVSRAQLHRFIEAEDTLPSHGDVDEGDIPTEWGGSPRRAMGNGVRRPVRGER